MKTKRKDLLCTGKTIDTDNEITGWYCEGNVLKDGTYSRKRKSFIIPEHPDLRSSTIGVTRLHGFIEVDPNSVAMTAL